MRRSSKQKRDEQHKEAPTNDDMAKLFAEEKPQMEVTHTVLATKKQLDALETQEIHKACESGKTVLNKKKKSVKAKATQEFKVAIISNRFEPKYEGDKRRYRIRYNDADGENILRFSVTEYGTKEAAEKAAYEKQNELLHKFGF